MNIEFPGAISRMAAATRPAATTRAAPAPEAATPAATPAGEGEAAVNLQEALDAIKAWLPEPVRTNLAFRVDDTLNRVVVSVVDAETGALVRQIPADVILRVAQNLQEFMGGLVDEVA